MLGLSNHLLNNIGYIIAIAFGLTHVNTFKRIIEKEKYNARDIVILSILFSAIAILGTYVGTDYNGAIANTRNIGVVVAGVVGGPIIGLVTGIVAGTHRYLIDIGGVTALPCAIATILGGLLSGGVYRKIDPKERKVYGFVAGIVVENLSMGFILLMSRPFELARDIVTNIYIPMVLANGMGAFIVIAITESILEEKKRMAGEQAKLILEVANKTLPHFRDLTNKSLINVCKIIRDSVEAELVAITDRDHILASYSSEEKYQLNHTEIVGIGTKQVLDTGEILIADELEDELKFRCCLKDLKSAIIAPLNTGQGTAGTLKLYFKENSSLTSRNKYLAIGLSQLISTQLEISRVERLKNEAAKAEIKALQAQINPHFLFNALHTVSSFVRIDPARARKVIIDLSTYLRYSIENGDRLVSIDKELEQVRAYVDIEKARFQNKFMVHYDIEEGVEKETIPSLTIQPLVENALKHGILKKNTGKNVYISVCRSEKRGIDIVIEDDGAGIEPEVIENIQTDNVKPEKIGLYNVHSRIKLLYGRGLIIERLENGTRISFNIEGGQ